MNAGPAARLRTWLDSRAAAAVDPDLAGRYRRLLDHRGADLTAYGPYGTAVLFVPGRRSSHRALEVDRHGHLLAVLRWADDALAEASVCIPDGSWLAIEPGIAEAAPWPRSDRLWHSRHPGRDAASTPLTVFAAVEYGAVDAIPALAEPARLPPGGGAVVLNLIASLALDQGRGALPYRGPYPTEQLFLTLLESFRFEPATSADPLASFTAGDLGWDPSPHERLFDPNGMYVQMRGRVEKVVWRGRRYYRPDWQSVMRHAPRRLRDVAGAVRCSLWALGTLLEDHLVLNEEGDLVEILAPTSSGGPSRALPATVSEGIVETVAATSAPALAPFVRRLAADLRAEWAPVDADLIAFDGDHLRLSNRLRDAAAARLSQAADLRERLTVGLAMLSEIARLTGDELRVRAQASLLCLPEDQHAAALSVETPPRENGGGAGRIAAAAQWLADDASAGRLNDQPDVEGDEGGDGHC